MQAFQVLKEPVSYGRHKRNLLCHSQVKIGKMEPAKGGHGEPASTYSLSYITLGRKYTSAGARIGTSFCWVYARPNDYPAVRSFEYLLPGEVTSTEQRRALITYEAERWRP